MSDITERLRDEATLLSGHSIDRGCVDAGIASNVANDAADEIDRLRAALGRVYQFWIDDADPSECPELRAECRLLLGAARRDGEPSEP